LQGWEGGVGTIHDECIRGVGVQDKLGRLIFIIFSTSAFTLFFFDDDADDDAGAWLSEVPRGPLLFSLFEW
jgi:hypothetical protein